MLRRSVVQKLDAVPGLTGGAHQAFLAPPDADKPYASVKLPASRGSGVISYAGTQSVEVRIYLPEESFITLDQLEAEIILTLNGVLLTDQVDGGKYELQWVPGGGDFTDEEKSLIGRLIIFETGIVNERS